MSVECVAAAARARAAATAGPGTRSGSPRGIRPARRLLGSPLLHGSVLLVLALALWLPRLAGPLDMRYDAGVYYILGTSLAEGRGYRLLNEPGEIEAIQYPPLLALFAAAHQALAGTSAPGVAGHWLRLSFCVISIGYVLTAYLMARRFLASGFAFLVALVTVLHVHTSWLSDLFFAEIPFALAATLFVLVAEGPQARTRRWLAAILAAGAYLLRTVGIALLAAWVGEAVLKRRWRRAAGRLLWAAAPVLAWQAYIAHVTGGPEYGRPAYPYQRAGYQYYNVGYLENLLYVDPFTPELGTISARGLADRAVENLRSIPAGLGEAVSSRAEWSESQLRRMNNTLALPDVPLQIVQVPLIALGALIVSGLVLMTLRGRYLVPLYVAGTIAAVALTPWPGQFERYLAPLTPVLAVALFTALGALRKASFRTASRGWRTAGLALTVVVTTGVLAQEAFALFKVYTRQHRTALYEGPGGDPREHRLFFYTAAWRSQDAALRWLASRAEPEAVIATSTPHWAYLKTGRKAVMPPFEPDVQRAQVLAEAVPVRYLVVDSLEFVDVSRRYARRLVQAFPERWEMVYAGPEGLSRVYRRLEASRPASQGRAAHRAGRSSRRRPGRRRGSRPPSS